MAKDRVQDWDTTAANNTDVGGVNIAEGMSPALVNNAMREMMSQTREAVAYKAADIASASSIDLTDAGSIVDVTGTTTITALGTTTAGTVRRVQFDGVLTLTHNGTSLILPGAANITTAAGDVAEFVSLGSGNWLCSNYTPSAIAPASVSPTGIVLPFAGSSAPAGYLLCYGQAVSRTTYANLFAVISTNYGSGDGSTTFNVPDLRGRAAVGKDDMGGSAANRVTASGSGITGTTLGASGGAETHTLTTAQIPAHSHTFTTADSTPASGPYVYRAASGSLSSQSTDNTGGGTAHNNTQPSIILNYIIKT